MMNLGKGRNLRNLLSGAAGIACAAWSPAGLAQDMTQAPAVPNTSSATGTQRPVSASAAGTQLLLPLSRSGQLYGDVLAEVYPDGRIRYNRSSLLEAMSPLLSAAGKERFAANLSVAPFVTAEDVARAGITLRYDPALLEIAIGRMEPAMMAVEVVGDPRRRAELPITMMPESLSGYLNLVGDFRLTDLQQLEQPGVLASGAVRYRGVVAEFDGGYDRNLSGSGSGFYRRSVRLVYDQVDRQRRWSAGDLQLHGLPISTGPILGGVAVEKGRRVFAGLAPLIPLGGQQILLDRDATIEVIVDGQQVQTLQLASGAYDLSQLRAMYGARDAQLFVTDISGRRQLASVDPFFSPVDLLEGEDEYSAAIGFVPTSFSVQPVYGRKPAFAGYYRRGVSNRLILGGAIQLTQRIQVAGAEIILYPRVLPGRFEASAAASIGESSGIALRGGYSLETGVGARARQISISADYRSSGFATIANLVGLRSFATLNLNASFSQNFTDRTSLVGGLSWFEREGFETTRSAYVDIVHRTRRFRLIAGVEYGTGVFDRNFGIRLGVSVPLSRRNRAEVNYNSRRDDFRAFYARSYEDTVGSIGYDLGISRSAGSARADGIVNYVGNRFYSRLSITSAGDGFTNLGDSQSGRLQVGTAIAFAGGSFAIGRPINDSFVIADVNDSLSGKEAVLTRSVSDRRYLATSGVLGPALGGRLNSYTPQSIVYDLKNGAEGYDIGTGIERVEPPYRSGYRLVVGSDATVTAYGFLNLPSGRASLVAGTITSPDDEDFGRQPFFTNSVGRFAIIGMRPGKTYEVNINDPITSYTIRVPADSPSLLRLDPVVVTPEPETGQE